MCLSTIEKTHVPPLEGPIKAWKWFAFNSKRNTFRTPYYDIPKAFIPGRWYTNKTSVPVGTDTHNRSYTSGYHSFKEESGAILDKNVGSHYVVREVEIKDVTYEGYQGVRRRQYVFVSQKIRIIPTKTDIDRAARAARRRKKVKASVSMAKVAKVVKVAKKAKPVKKKKSK